MEAAGLPVGPVPWSSVTALTSHYSARTKSLSSRSKGWSPQCECAFVLINRILMMMMVVIMMKMVAMVMMRRVKMLMLILLILIIY